MLFPLLTTNRDTKDLNFSGLEIKKCSQKERLLNLIRRYDELRKQRQILEDEIKNQINFLLVPIPEELTNPEDSDPNLFEQEKNIQAKERRKIFLKAIEELPDDNLKKVIHYFFFEDLPYSKICIIMGFSDKDEALVRKIKYEAIQKLRKIFIDKYGYNISKIL